jgi:hypothetical protein
MIPSAISDIPAIEPYNDLRGRSRKKRKRGRESTYVLESPYNKAGALTNCFPPLHRLHLNVSWVSHSVSLNSNNCLRSSWVKWRAVSSASSTTHADRFCFWHLASAHHIMNRGGMAYCLWKIFSSIVPVVWNLYTKPDLQPRRKSRGRYVHSFVWPSRHTRAKACWSLAGFQSYSSAATIYNEETYRIKEDQPVRSD